MIYVNSSIREQIRSTLCQELMDLLSVCPSIRRALRQKCESLPGEFGGMTDTLAEKVIAL
jgi:hypothetical protein